MNHYKLEEGFNIKTFIIVVSVLLLVSYGLFNARDLLLGPSIEIFSPLGNTEVGSNMVTVKGRAENVSLIKLNGNPISINTEGLFEEKLLLNPGSNIIEITARDRFKNEKTEMIKVYYKTIN